MCQINNDNNKKDTIFANLTSQQDKFDLIQGHLKGKLLRGGALPQTLKRFQPLFSVTIFNQCSLQIKS
ncbi:unnamed protein product [Paramecium octaurelia]|uniref:Uncharacterized protein n=1 Tax=Paramecium octaurelia TaxID=43137 RepID=A0A8S1X1M1_PAROT|nr:unnamed protein product [Paramecium octaurelia]